MAVKDIQTKAKRRARKKKNRKVSYIHSFYQYLTIMVMTVSPLKIYNCGRK